ncbi:hypothetical protein K402DRAFT_200619 [Aulographum hederae CBS 113979]|uniref:EDC4-like protein pdc1 beta-propeller domain-containing protein n=1 Tax=Aulographum hederae CBS 113979 TaxID=1176131 RepID=A0A6G1HC69_9PEZI|nr:hypothetical protein K402DRAFT_200619 [Aulographum hederae CBS 113979]
MGDDLMKDFLARLAAHEPANSPAPLAPMHSYTGPSRSNPYSLPQRPASGRASGVGSPNVFAPSNPQGPDRSADLLSLLKFNQPAQSGESSGYGTHGEERGNPKIGVGGHSGNSASAYPSFGLQSLVGNLDSNEPRAASFTRKPSSAILHNPEHPTSKPGPTVAPLAAANHNPEDFLLRLLNQSKPPVSPASTSQPAQSAKPTPPSISSDISKVQQQIDQLSLVGRKPSSQKKEQYPVSPPSASPMQHFGGPSGPQGKPLAESNSFEPQGTKKTLFNYVNPFDALAATSPLNRTPRPESRADKTEVPKHAREGRDLSDAGPAQKSRKISPGMSPAGSTKSPLPGTGQSVEEALDAVGKQVDREVEQALGQASKPSSGAAKFSAEPTQEQYAAKAVQDVQEAATEIQRDLKDDDARRAMESGMEPEAAEAFEETINAVAKPTENVVDSWESAESSAKEEDVRVRVYNFPMKPFVSIQIQQLHEPPAKFRDGSISEVVRLKKAFDQNDRSLVAASQRSIVYASPKHGGVKLVDQQSGTGRDAFKNPQERIFNISISTSPLSSATDGSESVIATADSGMVYWSQIDAPAGTELAFDKIDDRGFAFPPVPAQDDTSGGQLKTRVKKSSRHPKYFALGRGKSIHIIWPEIARSEYTNTQTNICDSKKYLADRSLKITTGKAGKDFVFSQCDTVIATLDKSGNMKFWDISELTHDPFANGNVVSKNISEPLISFSTTAAGDKAWPTSLMFLDKERPFNKGIALRYVLVGMKQNHSLQLWDLGLQKPVQEIHLPHENESDGICSLAYHPQSGVLVVGHPTRNSIYFIHLSAPRYILPTMTQAKYLERVAEKESSDPLPPPESTAIMSGIREYTLSKKGQLRSLDMLDCSHHSSNANYEKKDSPLFELYIMHSKGVTLLAIHKEDLGWDVNNAVVNPVDALDAAAITIGKIGVVQSENTAATSSKTESGPPSVTKSTREAVRETPAKKENASRRERSPTPSSTVVANTLARVENKQDAARTAILNGSESARKKKKRAGEAASQIAQISPGNEAISQSKTTSAPSNSLSQTTTATQPQPSTSRVNNAAAAATASSLSAQRGIVDEPSSTSQSLASLPTAPLLSPISSTPLLSAMAESEVKKMGEAIAKDISAMFEQHTQSLYKLFADEKRAQDASFSAKTDTVLRLVSSTLTDNVEKSLASIVMAEISAKVVPQIQEHVIKAFDRRLGGTMADVLNNSVPRELRIAFENPAVVGSLGKQLGIQFNEQFQRQAERSLIQALNLDQLTLNVDGTIERSVARLTDAVNVTINEQIQRSMAHAVNSENLTVRVNEQITRSAARAFSSDNMAMMINKQIHHSMANAAVPDQIVSLMNKQMKDQIQGTLREFQASFDHVGKAVNAVKTNSDEMAVKIQDTMEAQFHKSFGTIGSAVQSSIGQLEERVQGLVSRTVVNAIDNQLTYKFGEQLDQSMAKTVDSHLIPQIVDKMERSFTGILGNQLTGSVVEKVELTLAKSMGNFFNQFIDNFSNQFSNEFTVKVGEYMDHSMAQAMANANDLLLAKIEKQIQQSTVNAVEDVFHNQVTANIPVGLDKAITDAVAKAVDVDGTTHKLNEQLHRCVANALDFDRVVGKINEAVHSALNINDVADNFATKVDQSVVERAVSNANEMKQLVARSDAHEKHWKALFSEANKQQRADAEEREARLQKSLQKNSDAIDALTKKMDKWDARHSKLEAAMAALAESQARGQDEARDLRRQMARMAESVAHLNTVLANRDTAGPSKTYAAGPSKTYASPSQAYAAPPRPIPDIDYQEEFNKMGNMLQAGHFRDAILQLIAQPLGLQAQFFDTLFIHCDPGHIADLDSGLIMLALIALLTHGLENNTLARVSWVELCLEYLENVEVGDFDMRTHGYNIFGNALGRLDAILPKLPECISPEYLQMAQDKIRETADKMATLRARFPQPV